MDTLDDLLESHREVSRIADALGAAGPALAAPADAAREKVALFAAKLRAHVAIPDMASTAASAARAFSASAQKEEALALEENVARFEARYLVPGAIESDPAGFVTAWKALVLPTGRLLGREQDDVYPKKAAVTWSPREAAPPPTTGLARIDADHAQLFGLLKDLRAAARRHDNEPQAGVKVIGSLLEYADHHFALEEQLMKESGYPGLADHAAEHHRAHRAILGFRNDYLDGRLLDLESILGFVEAWLVSHIAYTDQAMVAHLRARKQTPAV